MSPSRFLPFDPNSPRCGVHTKRASVEHHAGRAPRTCQEPSHHCRQAKGYRTDHPGSGKCWLHGGRTPNGKLHAQREAVEQAVVKLGLPLGSGDPFTLLSKAVRHAEGNLEASAKIVVEAIDGKDGAKFDLERAVAVYVRAIREASRTGKAAVDADVADRMAALDERLGAVIHRILTVALDAAGVAGDARQLAEDALVQELLAVTPAGAELN